MYKLFTFIAVLLLSVTMMDARSFREKEGKNIHFVFFFLTYSSVNFLIKGVEVQGCNDIKGKANCGNNSDCTWGNNKCADA